MNACQSAFGWISNLVRPHPQHPEQLMYFDRAAEFSGIFHAILRDEKQSIGDWTGDYLKAKAAPANNLPPLVSEYSFLFISGIFSESLSPELTLLSDARDHLRSVHNLDVEYLDVPAAGSCEFNAKIIAEYIRNELNDKNRRFILVGYSKGLPDLQVMLALNEDLRTNIAALVSLAGCVRGSYLADWAIPPVELWYEDFVVGNVRCGDWGAVESLKHSTRLKFLANFPDPLVPTYSINAESTPQTTSTILHPSWKQLHQISTSGQDGQMMFEDSIVPKSQYIATTLSDHWALALPFELLQAPAVDVFVNKNRFPRVALLEAALRLISNDLKTEVR
jgi:hypothetical protein